MAATLGSQATWHAPLGQQSWRQGARGLGELPGPLGQHLDVLELATIVILVANRLENAATSVRAGANCACVGPGPRVRIGGLLLGD